MLLGRVTVTWRDYKIVNYDHMPCLVLLAVRVCVVNWCQVLLVVVAISIALNLLRKRSEVSKRIRCSDDIVLVIACCSTAVIHHVLTFSLRSQTLVTSKQTQWIDRDDLTLL